MTVCGPEQAANWCPVTKEEVLPSVVALLPEGPAWRAAQEEGTVMRAYWSTLAGVLAYAYLRICAFVDELFCATAKESLDQWQLEYGIGDPCDPYGHNLCAKIAAAGGARCDYFVDVARNAGWVITCRDMYSDPEPIAGCFEVGCTPLAGPYEIVNDGSNLGLGQLGGCSYGEIVAHPQRDYWNTDLVKFASCPVPGSSLGLGPQGDESCCFIVGYYEVDTSQPIVETDACVLGNTITFECPRQGVPAFVRGPCDLTGNYKTTYTNAFRWEVVIDIPASEALQGVTLVPEEYTLSAAGRMMAGGILNVDDGSYGGTPLCMPVDPQFPLCFIDRVKPAHTVLVTQVKLE